MELVNSLTAYPIGNIEDINGVTMRGIREKQGVAFSRHGWLAAKENPTIDPDLYGSMIRKSLRPLSLPTLNKARQEYADRTVVKFPRYFINEPNSSCNRKCVFCPIIVTNRKGNMKWDHHVKLMEECSNYDVMGLSLYQLSEPMLYRGKDSNGNKKDIADMVDVAKKVGGFRIVNISTNGDASNLYRLLECDVDDIFISIDGTTADVYDQNRPSTTPDDTGAFQRTMDRVHNFLDEKSRRGASKSWVRLQIINNELCAPQVLDFIRYWIQVDGVSDIYVKNLDGMSAWLGDKAVSKAESDIKMNKVRNMPCQHIYAIGSMVSDGRFNACCHDSLTELTTNGCNIDEMKFSEWWNGEYMTELRKEHESGATRRPCVECAERDPWL